MSVSPPFETCVVVGVAGLSTDMILLPTAPGMALPSLLATMETAVDGTKAMCRSRSPSRRSPPPLYRSSFLSLPSAPLNANGVARTDGEGEEGEERSNAPQGRPGTMVPMATMTMGDDAKGQCNRHAHNHHHHGHTHTHAHTPHYKYHHDHTHDDDDRRHAPCEPFALPQIIDSRSSDADDGDYDTHCGVACIRADGGAAVAPPLQPPIPRGIGVINAGCHHVVGGGLNQLRRFKIPLPTFGAVHPCEDPMIAPPMATASPPPPPPSLMPPSLTLMAAMPPSPRAAAAAAAIGSTRRRFDSVHDDGRLPPAPPAVVAVVTTRGGCDGSVGAAGNPTTQMNGSRCGCALTRSGSTAACAVCSSSADDDGERPLAAFVFPPLDCADGDFGAATAAAHDNDNDSFFATTSLLSAHRSNVSSTAASSLLDSSSRSRPRGPSSLSSSSSSFSSVAVCGQRSPQEVVMMIAANDGGGSGGFSSSAAPQHRHQYDAFTARQANHRCPLPSGDEGEGRGTDREGGASSNNSGGGNTGSSAPLSVIPSSCPFPSAATPMLMTTGTTAAAPCAMTMCSLPIYSMSYVLPIGSDSASNMSCCCCCCDDAAASPLCSFVPSSSPSTWLAGRGIGPVEEARHLSIVPAAGHQRAGGGGAHAHNDGDTAARSRPLYTNGSSSTATDSIINTNNSNSNKGSQHSYSQCDDAPANACDSMVVCCYASLIGGGGGDDTAKRNRRGIAADNDASSDDDDDGAVRFAADENGLLYPIPSFLLPPRRTRTRIHRRRDDADNNNGDANDDVNADSRRSCGGSADFDCDYDAVGCHSPADADDGSDSGGGGIHSADGTAINTADDDYQCAFGATAATAPVTEEVESAAATAPSSSLLSSPSSSSMPLPFIRCGGGPHCGAGGGDGDGDGDEETVSALLPPPLLLFSSPQPPSQLRLQQQEQPRQRQRDQPQPVAVVDDDHNTCNVLPSFAEVPYVLRDDPTMARDTAHDGPHNDAPPQARCDRDGAVVGMGVGVGVATPSLSLLLLPQPMSSINSAISCTSTAAEARRRSLGGGDHYEPHYMYEPHDAPPRDTSRICSTATDACCRCSPVGGHLLCSFCDSALSLVVVGGGGGGEGGEGGGGMLMTSMAAAPYYHHHHRHRHAAAFRSLLPAAARRLSVSAATMTCTPIPIPMAPLLTSCAVPPTAAAAAVCSPSTRIAAAAAAAECASTAFLLFSPSAAHPSPLSCRKRPPSAVPPPTLALSACEGRAFLLDTLALIAATATAATATRRVGCDGGRDSLANTTINTTMTATPTTAGFGATFGGRSSCGGLNIRSILGHHDDGDEAGGRGGEGTGDEGWGRRAGAFSYSFYTDSPSFSSSSSDGGVGLGRTADDGCSLSVSHASPQKSSVVSLCSSVLPQMNGDCSHGGGGGGGRSSSSLSSLLSPLSSMHSAKGRRKCTQPPVASQPLGISGDAKNGDAIVVSHHNHDHDRHGDRDDAAGPANSCAARPPRHVGNLPPLPPPRPPPNRSGGAAAPFPTLLLSTAPPRVFPPLWSPWACLEAVMGGGGGSAVQHVVGGGGEVAVSELSVGDIFVALAVGIPAAAAAAVGRRGTCDASPLVAASLSSLHSSSPSFVSPQEESDGTVSEHQRVALRRTPRARPFCFCCSASPPPRPAHAAAAAATVKALSPHQRPLREVLWAARRDDANAKRRRRRGRDDSNNKSTKGNNAREKEEKSNFTAVLHCCCGPLPLPQLAALAHGDGDCGVSPPPMIGLTMPSSSSFTSSLSSSSTSSPSLCTSPSLLSCPSLSSMASLAVRVPLLGCTVRSIKGAKGHSRRIHYPHPRPPSKGRRRHHFREADGHYSTDDGRQSSPPLMSFGLHSYDVNYLQPIVYPASHGHHDHTCNGHRLPEGSGSACTVAVQAPPHGLAGNGDCLVPTAISGDGSSSPSSASSPAGATMDANTTANTTLPATTPLGASAFAALAHDAASAPTPSVVSGAIIGAQTASPASSSLTASLRVVPHQSLSLPLPSPPSLGHHPHDGDADGAGGSNTSAASTTSSESGGNDSAGLGLSFGAIIAALGPVVRPPVPPPALPRCACCASANASSSDANDGSSFYARGEASSCMSVSDGVGGEAEGLAAHHDAAVPHAGDGNADADAEAGGEGDGGEGECEGDAVLALGDGASSSDGEFDDTDERWSPAAGTALCRAGDGAAIGVNRHQCDKEGSLQREGRALPLLFPLQPFICIVSPPSSPDVGRRAVFQPRVVGAAPQQRGSGG